MEETYQIEGGDIQFSQSFLNSHGVGSGEEPPSSSSQAGASGKDTESEEEVSIAQVEKEIADSIQRRRDDLDREKKALQRLMQEYFSKEDRETQSNYEETLKKYQTPSKSSPSQEPTSSCDDKSASPEENIASSE